MKEVIDMSHRLDRVEIEIGIEIENVTAEVIENDRIVTMMTMIMIRKDGTRQRKMYRNSVI